MPYGYNIDKRMKIVQGYMEEHSPEEDDDGVIYGLEYVIPDEIFEEFYTKVYEGNQEQLTSAKKANFEYEKIHNRAIFDSFNEALNVFRPYFQISTIFFYLRWPSLPLDELRKSSYFLLHC